MALPKVFVTRQILDPALELIAQSAQVEVWPEELPPPPEVLREKSAQVDGLLTNVMDRIDGPLLDAARGLKVISQLSVGLDNVDLPEATRRES